MSSVEDSSDGSENEENSPPAKRIFNSTFNDNGPVEFESFVLSDDDDSIATMPAVEAKHLTTPSQVNPQEEIPRAESTFQIPFGTFLFNK